jgi:hypothetical protein
MPTLDVEEDVYTFDELSEAQKDNARSWMRDCVGQDFDTEWIFESAVTAGNILGVEFNQTPNNKPDIRYSGFWSSGDGASFEGYYPCSPGARDKIRKEFPTETKLHDIADGLTALQAGIRLTTGKFISAHVKQSGRYVHSGTMEVLSREWDEDPIFGEDNETRLLDLMRRFADWIYRSLEDDYDHQMSDEAIDETLQGNEYEFDEDGDRA